MTGEGGGESASYCPECGSSVQATAKFCSECGEELKSRVGSPASDTTSTASVSGRVSTAIAWVTGGFIVLLSFIMLLYSTVSSLLLAITSLFILPPTRRFIETEFDYKLSKGAIIAVALLGVVAAGAASPPLEEQSSTTQGQNSQLADTATPATSEIVIQISYPGAWSGSIGTGGSSKSVEGVGTAEYVLDEDATVVSATIQKRDDSSERLNVRIVKNGNVVAEQSTTASYGVVSVSESFF